MEPEPKSPKLSLPVVLVVTVLGVAGAVAVACTKESSCPADDGGAQAHCDAGAPDAPFV
jgi:hypothetical protein